MYINDVKALLDQGNDPKELFSKVFEDTAEKLNKNYLDIEDVEGYLYLYNHLKDNNLLDYEDDEGIYIEFLTMNVYRLDKRFWRGKPNAYKLISLLENKDLDLEKDFIADAYFEAGTFFKMVSLHEEALKAFTNSYKYRQDSSTLFYIVVMNNLLGRDYVLKEEDKKYVNARVELAIKKKGYLKVDPVENTKEFLDIYDEVHEEAMDIIEKEGDLHLCHQLWGVLFDLYLARGVMWSSPALMNPGTRFD